MSWPRSEWVVLVVLVIITGGVLFFVRPPQIGESTQAKAQVTADAATPTTSPTAEAEDEELVSIPEDKYYLRTIEAYTGRLDQDTLARVSGVVTMYASYPNKEGAAATLQRLDETPLLSDEALQSVTAQWQGSDLSTVEFKATEVTIGGEQPGENPNQVILQTVVRQDATFANTPNQVFHTQINATLEQQDGEWMIVDLWKN